MKTLALIGLLLASGCVATMHERVYKAAVNLPHLVAQRAKPDEEADIEAVLRRQLQDWGMSFPEGSFLSFDTNTLVIHSMNTSSNNDLLEVLLLPVGTGEIIHRIR